MHQVTLQVDLIKSMLGQTSLKVKYQSDVQISYKYKKWHSKILYEELYIVREEIINFMYLVLASVCYNKYISQI